MAELTILDIGSSIDEVLPHLDRDGGVIVRGLLSEETIDRFKADIEQTTAEHPAGATTGAARTVEFWGSSTKRFTRLAHRSEAFEDILLAPTLLGVCDRILLESTQDYWLNTGQMMVIGPGESVQMQHRDANNWPALCQPTSPEVTISCMYALGEFTTENGATHVVPGSHKWDDYKQVPTDDQVAIAEMQPGDGMIYSGRVIHNAGANVTDDHWRLGLHVSFVLGWLTPEEALPISVPWESAQKMSERSRRLLGWESYGEDSRLWTVDYEKISVALGHG